MFRAILDANVLYPAPVRDFLLSLASEGLYIPKWSAEIQNEWIRNLLIKRKDIQRTQLDRTVSTMEKAFPDAKVVGYESLLDGLHLPDLGDEHVLAAGIRCNAKVIVTQNIKHFPNDYLSQFDMEAQLPDSFVTNIIDLDPDASLEALTKQVSRLRNPPRSIEEVLSVLEGHGLISSVSTLRSKLR
jgi:hypothetical protein